MPFFGVSVRLGLKYVDERAMSVAMAAVFVRGSKSSIEPDLDLGSFFLVAKHSKRPTKYSQGDRVAR